MQRQEAPGATDVADLRATPRAPDAPHAGHPAVDRPWLVLAILLVATFMGILDAFIVNVAIPDVQARLHASFAEVQLVVAGYALAYSVGLVTGGRLGDSFGQRRVFLLGTALFGLASAACSAAPNPTALIVLRVLQGLGAAVMLPQVLSMIQIIFPPGDRPRAIGYYGATLGLGAVLGQVVGGGLLAWNPLDLGWRAVFLVNLPLCALAMVGTRLTVAGMGGGAGARLDLVGVLLLGSALFTLLHPVIMAGQSGWSRASAVELGGSVALFLGFLRWEQRVAASGAAPLLPPALFAQSGFSKGLGTALFFYSTNTAFVLVLTYFLQRGLRLTPMQAALEFVPMAAATGLGSLALAPLRNRFGHGVAVLGGVLAVAGLLLTLSAPGTGNSLAQLLMLQPGLLLYGVGGGLVAPSIVGLSLAQTDPADAGAASGGLLTVTQAANAAGVAAIGAVFSAVAASSSLGHAFDVTLLVVGVLCGIAVAFLASLRRAGRKPVPAHDA